MIQTAQPTLPSYLKPIIPYHLLSAFSRLQTFRSQPDRQTASATTPQIWGLSRVAYELRICSKCNWHYVQDVEHVLWTAPVHTWQICVSSTITSTAHPLVAQTGLDILLAEQTPQGWLCLCIMHHDECLDCCA